jgi:rSAM/selenodomain-associated transferase 1
MTPPANDKALLLFVRNPEPGRVKTRLAAGIGDERALAVYRHLMAHVRDVALAVDADRFVFYSDHVERGDAFDDRAFRKYVQCSGDLGARMEFAFSIPFKMGGYKRVQIVGSDLPGLTPELVERGFEALASHDATLGPAAALFRDKAWSTATVLEETRAQIDADGGRVFLLPELRDVDTEEDWIAAGRPGDPGDFR